MTPVSTIQQESQWPVEHSGTLIALGQVLIQLAIDSRCHKAVRSMRVGLVTA